MRPVVKPVCSFASVLLVFLVFGGGGFSSAAGAQTIADYSRSQRAVIEAEIARNNAQSTGGRASATPLPLPGAAGPAALPSPSRPPERPLPPIEVEPRLSVSGVFVSARHAVAEVIVEGVPYMLSAGQDVPGTAWRVQKVTVERVVLGGHADSGASRKGSPRSASSRVFHLPPSGR